MPRIRSRDVLPYRTPGRLRTEKYPGSIYGMPYGKRETLIYSDYSVAGFAGFD